MAIGVHQNIFVVTVVNDQSSIIYFFPFRLQSTVGRFQQIINVQKKKCLSGVHKLMYFNLIFFLFNLYNTDRW